MSGSEPLRSRSELRGFWVPRAELWVPRVLERSVPSTRGQLRSRSGSRERSRRVLPRGATELPVSRRGRSSTDPRPNCRIVGCQQRSSLRFTAGDDACLSGTGSAVNISLSGGFEFRVWWWCQPMGSERRGGCPLMTRRKCRFSQWRAST